MTVMTHVKALQAGHSSQGTSEPITPGTHVHTDGEGSEATRPLGDPGPLSTIGFKYNIQFQPHNNIRSTYTNSWLLYLATNQSRSTRAVCLCGRSTYTDPDWLWLAWLVPGGVPGLVVL